MNGKLFRLVDRSLIKGSALFEKAGEPGHELLWRGHEIKRKRLRKADQRYDEIETKRRNRSGTVTFLSESEGLGWKEYYYQRTREREAFVKRYLDGLTAKQVAQHMSTTDRAVNLLTFNARKKLRMGLEQDGYSSEAVAAALHG